MNKKMINSRILRPILEGQRSAWHILEFFAETAKTESAFWRRFADLPHDEKEFLAAFYATPTPWALFRRICLFWNVRARHEKERGACSVERGRE